MESFGPDIVFGLILPALAGWLLQQQGEGRRKLKHGPILLERGPDLWRVSFRVERPQPGGTNRRTSNSGTVVAIVEARVPAAWRYLGEHRTPFRPRGSYDKPTRGRLAVEAVLAVIGEPPPPSPGR